MAKKSKPAPVPATTPEATPAPSPEQMAAGVGADMSNEEAYTAPAPVVSEKRQRPAGETIVSGAAFWDFEKEPVFVGTYIRNVIREKDGKNAATNPNEKAGTVMGFLFRGEDGGEHIIGNSYSIQKALVNEKYRSVPLWIEFEGKDPGPPPFNRFHIQTVG